MPLIDVTTPMVCELCGLPINLNDDRDNQDHYVALIPERGAGTIRYGNWDGEPTRYFHTGGIGKDAPCYVLFVDALAAAGVTRRRTLPNRLAKRMVCAERNGMDIIKQRFGQIPIYLLERPER